MAANSTLTVPEGLFKELEERARAHGITVDGEAAELLAKALERDKRESQLMSEIRKEREELARRGVFLTDDVIQQARKLGTRVIVADTNLVAYVIIPGTNTPAAERVRAKDSDWIAPPLLRYELMNVVTQAFRQGELDRDEAARIYRRGLSLVTLEDLPTDPITILNLCHSSGCSPYDLEFVRLAMEHNVQLVTEDGKLLLAFPDNAKSMSGFGASS